MKHLYLCLALLFCVGINLSAQQRDKEKKYKIVLDAGHGGNKPGAIGLVSSEKEIALSVTLKLGKLISYYLPNSEVIYTRTKDVDVDLYERPKIANKNKADLFISIHCNSSKNKNAIGSETFVMGLTKSEENLNVAKTENADVLLEKNYELFYEGFDPKSTESHIMFSLYQNEYMDQSLNFASKIQTEFQKTVKSVNRGVKQSGFVVLYGTAMPAVLIEIGFISSPKEEKYLISEKGQIEIAASILRAICQYKLSERRLNIDIPSVEQIKNDFQHNFPEKTKPPPVAVNKQKKDTVQTAQTTPPQTKDSISFRVQILSSREKLSLQDSRLKGATNVWAYEQDGIWRYTSGNFQTDTDAANHQQEIRSNGFKDAFVVAFLHDKRIPLNEAKQLQLSLKK